MANDVANCIVNILKEDDDDLRKLFEQTKKRKFDLCTILKAMIKVKMMDDLRHRCMYNIRVCSLCTSYFPCVKRESSDVDKEKYAVFYYVDCDYAADKRYIVCDTMKQLHDSDFVKKYDFRFIWRYNIHDSNICELYLTWEHWK